MKKARTVYRIRAVQFSHEELIKFLREKVNKDVADEELELNVVDRDGVIRESINVGKWQELQIAWPEVL